MAALIAVIVGYALQLIRIRQLTELDLLRYGKAFVLATTVSAGVLAVSLGGRFLGLIKTPRTNTVLGFVACVIAYAICVPTLLRIKERA